MCYINGGALGEVLNASLFTKCAVSVLVGYKGVMRKFNGPSYSSSSCLNILHIGCLFHSSCSMLPGRTWNNIRVTVDDIREWKAGAATLWVRVNVSFGSHSANVITDSRLVVILLLPVQ